MHDGQDHPVKVARLHRGWRLVDLASRCGRAASLLSMVENGYVPKRSTQLAIAKALEVPVDSLFPVEEA